MQENGRRRIEYDFVRLICAVGIIVFHFSCHVEYREFLPLYEYANGKWGGYLLQFSF